MIRHAQTKIEPDKPPEMWNLSPKGESGCIAFAETLDLSDVSHIYHSPEPKAHQTAHLIASVADDVQLHADAGLRELEMRVGFLTQMEFERRVGAYLAGHEDADFEPYAMAQEQIASCVRRATERYPSESIAFVSHGRILTAFFSHLRGHRLGVSEWKKIRLPDLILVNPDTWTIEDTRFQ